MRWLLLVAASIAVIDSPHPPAFQSEGRAFVPPPVDALALPAAQDSAPRVVLDNARVRAYRTTAAALGRVEHGSAVVVSLEGASLGNAVWMDNAAAGGGVMQGAIVVVQPKETSAPPPAPQTGGSRPGESPFTGMSFTPMFSNSLVAVTRARMEVGAREGFHTHASDTIVVHLSGGAIEDTADGKTVINRWQPGDVEFEARGSSHSARNTGAAVDVVLVALTPR
jgi:quercetin dioxygenase-like cupin family protein